MSDINALEARIAAALERLQHGIAALSVPRPDGFDADNSADKSDDDSGAAPDPETVRALKDQIDEERTANAQLEERVRALKERQDQKLSVLESQVATQRAQMADLDAELQKLQAANAELRAVASEMRNALMDETSDGDMINRAILAELGAVTAAQSADRAEIDAILGELMPIVEEA